MVECPVCASEIDLPEGTIKNEILECPDCSTELEVVSLDPLELIEAPDSEEDWGQ